MATYYDLVIQDPLSIRDKGYSNQPASQWYHANCGGKIQIGDDAFYKCLKCGHSSHVKNWSYSPSNYEMSDKQTFNGAFAEAISIAGHITGIAGPQWLITFIENLGDDW